MIFSSFLLPSPRTCLAIYLMNSDEFCARLAPCMAVLSTLVAWGPSKSTKFISDFNLFFQFKSAYSVLANRKALSSWKRDASRCTRGTVSAPQMAWEAMVKKRWLTLDLIQDPSKYQCYVSHGVPVDSASHTRGNNRDIDPPPTNRYLPIALSARGIQIVA